MKPAFRAKTEEKGKTTLQELFLRGGKKVTAVCLRKEDYYELS